MVTFAYLLCYASCLLGPAIPQTRGACAWADLNQNGFVDLRDIAAWYNDAGCVIQTNTIRPERLIVDSCGVEPE